MFPVYPRAFESGVSWLGVVSMAKPPPGFTVNHAQPDPNTPCAAAVKFDLKVSKEPNPFWSFRQKLSDGVVELTGANVCNTPSCSRSEEDNDCLR